MKTSVIGLIAIGLLAGVLASAHGAPSPTWQYETFTDELTGKTGKIAAIRSVNTIEFGFPYQGKQRAILGLRRHPRDGVSVLLVVERGQFMCAIGGCVVLVRFDDAKPIAWDAHEPAGFASNGLFIGGTMEGGWIGETFYEDNRPEAFIARLRNAKTLRIAATFFQEGERTFIFHVAGLKW